MIGRLRKRFILSACGAVLLVLILLMGTINVLNYREVVSDADTLLAILAENNGEMPDAMFGEDGPPPRPDGAMTPPEGEMASPGGNTASSVGSGSVPGGAGDRRGGLFGKRDLLTAETPFESRYFSIQYDPDTEEIVAVSTANIASVDADTARVYAQNVLSGRADRGFLDDYRFLKMESTNVQDMVTTEGNDQNALESGDGDQGTAMTGTVCFLDCSRSLDNFYSFLRLSLIVSLLAFVVAAGVIVLASKRVLRPVAESYEKQKTFITDAGHELRTPITTIDADAEVLAMDIGENEWLADIRAQTKRLRDLTGELTYLSRMDEEKKDVPMIAFALSDVVTDVVQSFESRALLEKKTIHKEIAPMLSLTGEEAQIRKLVSILLDNAMKYSADEGEIAVTLSAGGKGPVLTVANPVTDMDPETVRHMFERFYRGDKSRSQKKSGFGIGLSIARSIMDTHGGKISAALADQVLTITCAF